MLAFHYTVLFYTVTGEARKFLSGRKLMFEGGRERGARKEGSSREREVPGEKPALLLDYSLLSIRAPTIYKGSFISILHPQARIHPEGPARRALLSIRNTCKDRRQRQSCPRCKGRWSSEGWIAAQDRWIIIPNDYPDISRLGC